MSVAALISDMVRAGVDPDIIGRTAQLLASREPMIIADEAAERRRAADRERKRLRNSAEFCGTPSPEVSEGFPTPLPNLPNPIPKKTPKGVQKGVSGGEAILIEAGCSESLLADWKSVRKAKNAGPITETVARGIGREAEKAGMTVRQAITTSCERGWQGFKAEWIDKPNARAGPSVNANRRPDTMFAALDRILPDGPDDQTISPSVVCMLPGSG